MNDIRHWMRPGTLQLQALPPLYGPVCVELSPQAKTRSSIVDSSHTSRMAAASGSSPSLKKTLRPKSVALMAAAQRLTSSAMN